MSLPATALVAVLGKAGKATGKYRCLDTPMEEAAAHTLGRSAVAGSFAVMAGSDAANDRTREHYEPV